MSYYEYERCIYSTKLVHKLCRLDRAYQIDLELVDKAIFWAKKHHAGQMRKSGEPFYSHPLEVAYMIADYSLKTEVIVASILHDIVEDTEVTAGMILDAFGRRIEEMVDRLTRVRPDGRKWTVEELLNNAYQKGDVDVLLIKLIDRLHNMQTIESMDAKKIEKTINETLINFILLSEYLQLTYLSKKIQQLCRKNKNEAEQNLSINIFSFKDNYQPLSLIFQNS